jgi:hypothetical protein
LSKLPWDPTDKPSDLRKIDFICLVAQIPIVVYVKAKVLAEPGLLQSNPRWIPILENVVFGWDKNCPDFLKAGLEEGRDRTNLLDFLLKIGPDSKEVKDLHERVFDATRGRRYGSKSARTAYWSTVFGLLDKCEVNMPRKSKLRTLL